tara:strand:- start:642 stop:902 length:261 start_codon:yes stop_codon:yes gene_type:complete
MAFKMNGWSAFTKQTMQGKPTPPTGDEGSDAWRNNFLKQHNVTSSEVNAAINEIGGGEDDVDFDDWKALVKKISENKKGKEETTAK